MAGERGSGSAGGRAGRSGGLAPGGGVLAGYSRMGSTTGASDKLIGAPVTPDGKRFQMVLQKDLPPEPPIELVLVDNGFEELKQRAPAK